MLNYKYSVFRCLINREQQKQEHNSGSLAASQGPIRIQVERVLAYELINIQLSDPNECFWLTHTYTHTHTGGEVVKATDGGKACCCLFSPIFYSKAGCLLFNCIFCIELIASRLGVAVWDDRQVSRGKEIITLPLKCTFVQVSECLHAFSRSLYNSFQCYNMCRYNQMKYSFP